MEKVAEAELRRGWELGCGIPERAGVDVLG